MIEYYILILIVFMFSAWVKVIEENIQKRSRKFVRGMSFVLTTLTLTLFSGLRYYVGTDYTNYITIYYNTPIREEISNAPLFYLLNDFLYSISTNYILFFIITSFIISFLINKAIYKESRYVEISIIIYICFGFYLTSMNVIRQYIAIAIIFNGYKYIASRQWKRYFFINIIAIMIHASALIMIPMWWILNINFNRKKAKYVIILTGILFVFLNKFVDIFIIIVKQFTKYENSFFLTDGASPIFFLITLGIYILILLHRKQIISNSKLGKVYLNALLLGTIFSFFSMKANILLRVSDFFRVVIIIMIPQVISLYKRRNRVIFYLVTILGMLILLTGLLFLNHGHIVPYQMYKFI